jgi:hypothetical protein
LLHHHEHDKQLTQAERETLLSEGTPFPGDGVHTELSDDHRVSQVRVSVRFEDGHAVPAPALNQPVHRADVGSTERFL